MKKLAFISPMALPVSKETGGGVEQLMYLFIIQNEENPHFFIDLFTVPLKEDDKKKFKYTNFIEIKLAKREIFFQKFINLFNYLLGFKKCDLMMIKVVKSLKKNRYDKILVENRMGFCKAILENTIQNVFYHMHNDFDESDKTVENFIYIEDKITKIFCVSNFIKESLLSKKISSKVVVVPNCIDLKKFELSIDEKNMVNKLKRKFKFNNNDYIIGFAGRITEEKGIEELILAFKKIYTKVKNIRLLVIGNSWFADKNPSLFEKQLHMLVDEDIADKIVFTGYVEHDIIKLYYELIDTLVIPSKCNEAFGLVALEAIAMKKNIITTGKGGLREITQEVAQMVREEELCDDLYHSLLKSINNSAFIDDNSKKISMYFVDHKEYNPKYYFESICHYVLDEENIK